MTSCDEVGLLFGFAVVCLIKELEFAEGDILGATLIVSGAVGANIFASSSSIRAGSVGDSSVGRSSFRDSRTCVLTFDGFDGGGDSRAFFGGGSRSLLTVMSPRGLLSSVCERGLYKSQLYEMLNQAILNWRPDLTSC